MFDSMKLKTRPLQSCDRWGATVTEAGTCFRIWAPNEASVTLVPFELPMDPVGGGWFETCLDAKPFGRAYGFRLTDGTVVADPASRQQQSGLEGLSILTNPHSYQWRTREWAGRPWEDAVIYELHVGTFTPEGTFEAATKQLDRLARLGFSAIELMPIAHFPGGRGWGYDGVLHYAPHAPYGKPDDLKALVDAAHDLGIMVFLDVVYNHFGPEGNFLGDYAPSFFRAGKENAWGAEIAFEEDAVRQFFIGNALYWLQEFRLDGLRFDAVNEIKDGRRPHCLQVLSERIAREITDRHVHLITENPPNGTDLLAKHLFIADWNDAFHHVVHSIATKEDKGIFEPYSHAPFQKLRKILSQGYLTDGEATLGEPLVPSASLPPRAFVHFLQNHDQVGNRALGERLHSLIDDRLHRTLIAMLLLSPQIPLLFMGDCFKASTPFLYFADYEGAIADEIRAARPSEAENFGGIPRGYSIDDIADPNDERAFLRSKLDWSQAETSIGKAWSSWLQRLISVRRDMIIPHLGCATGYAGELKSAPEECVFINWKLGDHILQLRLNLSSQDVEIDGELGDCIWPDPDAVERKHLMPTSLRAFLLKI